MKKFERRIAVTGGAGFIGSNLLLHLVRKYPNYQFVNIDSLTYAGNLSNLTEIETAPNYQFEKIDIRDYEALSACFDKYDFDGLIHLAAESHVDRSISGPSEFITTNINGTFNLLELARAITAEGKRFRFHHVSTDEVYGSLGPEGYFTEESLYRPNSPYSASKASSDHLARAYHMTYGIDVVTTNCSNNYGPFQFPEKLIPLMINNAREGKPLPVYGDGKQIRDWLYVVDHCEAIDLVFHDGQTGLTYNIGGHNEIENIQIVKLLCRLLNEKLECEPLERLIKFVTDRPGHDRRYAIDASFIKKELGWTPRFTFEQGIEQTIDWYLNHHAWLAGCVSGDYRKYYDKMYASR